MPGARIARMKNVKLEEDANVVIVHAGTCNIHKQTNPENLAEEIISTLRDVKADLPKALVAISSILERNDALELNAKVLQTTNSLKKYGFSAGLTLLLMTTYGMVIFHFTDLMLTS